MCGSAIKNPGRDARGFGFFFTLPWRESDCILTFSCRFSLAFAGVRTLGPFFGEGHSHQLSACSPSLEAYGRKPGIRIRRGLSPEL